MAWQQKTNEKANAGKDNNNAKGGKKISNIFETFHKSFLPFTQNAKVAISQYM